MKELILKLRIIDCVSNDLRHKNGLKRLGRGYSEAYRVNPFNPISYIAIFVSIPILLLMYGFVGLYEKASNPFKWD